MSSDASYLVPHETYCDWHRKKAFTKKNARRAIRQMHDKGMREYPCEVLPGLWHAGHLPWAVRQGKMTVTDVFGPRP